MNAIRHPDPARDILMPPGCWPDLPHASLRQFLRHWAEQRGEALMAPRAAIDPLALRDCLPCLWIYRWEEEQQDFVCTLAGEAVNEAWGMRLTGQTLGRLMGPDNAAVVRARYHKVLRLPALQYSWRPIMPQGAVEKVCHRLILPVADGDGAAQAVLGMTVYEYDRFADADKPINVAPDVEVYPCAGLPRGLPPA